MPIDPTHYERAFAITTHAVITRSVSEAYPDLSSEDHDAMVIGIIDRLARLRGWSVRRERVNADEDE